MFKKNYKPILFFSILSITCADLAAETTCYEDKSSETGYKCFETEYIYATEELVKPLLRKKDEKHLRYSNSPLSEEQLYQNVIEISQKLKRKSEQNNLGE